MGVRSRSSGKLEEGTHVVSSDDDLQKESDLAVLSENTLSIT